MGSMTPGRIALNDTGVAWIGAILAVAMGQPAQGQARPPDRPAAGPLETVVVTATRGPRAVEEVAATVTVKSDADIEAELAADARARVQEYLAPGRTVASNR